MAEVVFLSGLLFMGLGALWEHPKWSRPLVVLGVLLMLFALAPTLGRWLA